MIGTTSINGHSRGFYQAQKKYMRGKRRHPTAACSRHSLSDRSGCPHFLHKPVQRYLSAIITSASLISPFASRNARRGFSGLVSVQMI